MGKTYKNYKYKKSATTPAHPLLRDTFQTRRMYLA